MLSERNNLDERQSKKEIDRQSCRANQNNILLSPRCAACCIVGGTIVCEQKGMDENPSFDRFLIQLGKPVRFIVNHVETVLRRIEGTQKWHTLFI